MPRRREVPKREILPDPQYHDVLISKFMNCQFTNNQAGSGAGLYLETEVGSATAILNGCTVAGNTALTSGGGGIKADGQMISLIDCVITGNTALGSGGGLDCVGNSAWITGCHFANNTVTGSKSYGGAIRLYTCAGSISDCTIEGNAASFWGGGISLYESSATIANCLIRNNSTDQVGGGTAVGQLDLGGNRPQRCGQKDDRAVGWRVAVGLGQVELYTSACGTAHLGV